MGMNQRPSPFKWDGYEPQTELFHRDSGEPLEQADGYVTKGELKEFHRSICDLMSVFLEFYLTSAIELDAPYFGMYLN